MKDIFWAGPVFADFIQIFIIGALYTLSKRSLPESISGGFLFGLLISVFFASIALFMASFTNSMNNTIWWVWALYQFIESVTVSVIYSSLPEK